MRGECWWRLECIQYSKTNICQLHGCHQNTHVDRAFKQAATTNKPQGSWLLIFFTPFSLHLTTFAPNLCPPQCSFGRSDNTKSNTKLTLSHLLLPFPHPHLLALPQTLPTLIPMCSLPPVSLTTSPSLSPFPAPAPFLPPNSSNSTQLQDIYPHPSPVILSAIPAYTPLPKLECKGNEKEGHRPPLCAWFA